MTCAAIGPEQRMAAVHGIFRLRIAEVRYEESYGDNLKMD